MTLTNFKDTMVDIRPYLPQSYFHHRMDQKVFLCLNITDWLEQTEKEKELVPSEWSPECSTQEAPP